jgi:hypothetical protein
VGEGPTGHREILAPHVKRAAIRRHNLVR